jgi:mono/diheme cytochrome c family protein
MTFQRVPLWLGAVTALALIVSAFLLGRLMSAPSVRLRPDVAGIVQRGAQVYRAECAPCHGAQLQGQPNWREPGHDGLLPAPPHDPSGHTWHHPDELLFRITKYGVAKGANLKDYKSAMPAYEGVLSDEDIVAVLSWIKAQWPAPIRARSASGSAG